MKRFNALYTHQKTKKIKNWKEGYIVSDTFCGKITLLDENRNQLDCIFTTTGDVGNGDELDFNRFIVQVEDEQIISETTEVMPKEEEEEAGNEVVETKQVSNKDVKLRTKKSTAEVEMIEFKRKIYQPFITPFKKPSNEDSSVEKSAVNINYTSSLKPPSKIKPNEPICVKHIVFATDVKYSFNLSGQPIPINFDSFEKYKEYQIALIKDSLQCSLNTTLASYQQKRIHSLEHERSSSILSSNWFTEYNSRDLNFTTLEFNFKPTKPTDTPEGFNITPSISPLCNLQIKFKSRKDFSSFIKDDLWIISLSKKFIYEETLMFRSMYHGCSGSSVQLSCLTPSDIEKFPKLFRKVQVGNPIILKGFNIASEASIIECLLQNDGKDELLSYLINPSNPLELENEIDKNKDTGVKMELCELYSILDEGEKEALDKDIDDLLDEFLSKYTLNEDQFTALKNFKDQLLTNNNPCLLIHGVFGSGKSYLLAICIIFSYRISLLNTLIERPRILISCMTNTAVDNILLSLLNLEFDEFIRVGSLKRINKNILPYCIQSKKRLEEDIKDLKSLYDEEGLTEEDINLIDKTIKKFQSMNNGLKVERIINTCHVVAVTCLATNFPCLENQKFNILFMDEVSQVTEGLSLLPILKFNPKSILLVGDPLQLSPTLTNVDSNLSLKKRLSMTLFDRLMRCNITPIILRTQYRCHPAISNLSNKLFYNNKLFDGINELERKPLLTNLPILSFIDVQNGKEAFNKNSRSFYNQEEVDLISELINKLISLGIHTNDIGVICMYKKQVEKVESMLGLFNPKKKKNKIKVSTIDAFQGAEKNIIILSTVRSNPYNINFLNNQERVNVALSRAKHHLFLVGNYNALIKLSIWNKIILSYCKVRQDGFFSNGKFSEHLNSLQKLNDAADDLEDSNWDVSNYSNNNNNLIQAKSPQHDFNSDEDIQNYNDEIISNKDEDEDAIIANCINTLSDGELSYINEEDTIIYNDPLPSSSDSPPPDPRFLSMLENLRKN